MLSPVFACKCFEYVQSCGCFCFDLFCVRAECKMCVEGNSEDLWCFAEGKLSVVYGDVWFICGLFGVVREQS